MSIENLAPGSTWKSGSLKIACTVLAVVAALFLFSGPLVRWVGTSAGSGTNHFQEAAWFVNPAAASAGVKGGSIVPIAITANQRSAIHWWEAVGGIPVSSGMVSVGPGEPSEVRVVVPIVSATSWVTISVGRLATALRVEVKR